MSVIETFYREEVTRFPRSLRRVAADLPRRLGISNQSRGGWDDYVRLPPFRDLPGFAAANLTVPHAALSLYRRASWLGCFFGLLADRVFDGQASSGEVAAVGNHLLARWHTTLTAALGDRRRAAVMISTALRHWECGVLLERQGLAGGLSPRVYVTLVRAKVRWVTATACAMVEAYAPTRATDFAEATELLVLAAQYEDDTLDADDDASRWGRSVPDALGLPRESFLSATSGVLALSSAVARRGGFIRLAEWIDVHAEGRPRPGGVTGIAALALVQAAHEQCRRGN
jgi:hypothetical protein